MYSVETAKMSTKGQLVVPEVFRKQYGWTAGMTLLLIGTGNSVLVQPMTVPEDAEVDAKVQRAQAALSDFDARVRKARTALGKMKRLGISLPDGIERSDALRERMAGKYA